LELRDVLASLGLCIAVVGMWFLYAYFIVMPVMNVPLWTVGGILILLGAIALAAVLAFISIILILAIFS